MEEREGRIMVGWVVAAMPNYVHKHKKYFSNFDFF